MSRPATLFTGRADVPLEAPVANPLPLEQLAR